MFHILIRLMAFLPCFWEHGASYFHLPLGSISYVVSPGCRGKSLCEDMIEVTRKSTLSNAFAVRRHLIVILLREPRKMSLTYV